MTWQIHYRVYRQKDGSARPHYDLFTVEMEPDESVLDGVEKVWAHHDRTLTFRHACHHASCGTCGMRVNGVERLTCVTAVRDVAQNGASLSVEPMRNFPVISDLVVDMAPFFQRMEATHLKIIRGAEATLANGRRVPAEQERFNRFENCIECGLCMSACPIVGTDSRFLGPAALAGIWRMLEEPRGAATPALLELGDDAHGAWRCHTGFECTTACPSNVDPAASIMKLRRRIVVGRLKSLIGLSG